MDEFCCSNKFEENVRTLNRQKKFKSHFQNKNGSNFKNQELYSAYVVTESSVNTRS